MRSNNLYITKVIDELDVYRKYMLDEHAVTLSVTQADTFKKLSIVRAYLLDGYSDKQVLNFCKTDAQLNVQDRRGREILAIAYELFADLRIERPSKGLKYLYAEIFTQAAQEILEAAKEAREQKDYKSAAALFKEWRATKTEAAKIERVYDDEIQDSGEGKKAKKVVYKTVVINNNNYASDSEDTNALDIPHTEV